MPNFKVIGRGAKTNRKRTRVYRAIDEDTARNFAEQEGTAVESIEELPSPPAAPELVALAESVGLGLSEAPTRMEAVHSLLVHAIHRGLVFEITDGGTAYDQDMNEVQWRARIRPLAIQCSPQGWRVKCEVEPIGTYLIGPGTEAGDIRLFLIEDFDTLKLV